MTARPEAIDLSSNNGQTDMAQVKRDGLSMVIIKATQGTEYVNPYFAGEWHQAHALGLVRGAYHYGDGSGSLAEARVEAQHFLATVGPLQPGDVLVLDAETAACSAAWAVEFLHYIEVQTQKTPWLYSGLYFILEHLQDVRLAKYPLWLADYTTTEPRAPKPWTRWALWQNTDRQVEPGIGAVDHSIFNGDLVTLRRLAGGTPPKADPTPAPRPAQPVPAWFHRNLVYPATDHGSPIVLIDGHDGHKHPAHTGQDIVHVQHRLAVNPADGVYGPATAAAVSKFKKSRHLPTDGEVDAQTASALG